MQKFVNYGQKSFITLGPDVELFARDNSETVANATKMMTGKAAVWMDNLTRESPELASDWRQCYKNFFRNFAVAADKLGQYSQHFIHFLHSL